MTVHCNIKSERFWSIVCAWKVSSLMADIVAWIQTFRETGIQWVRVGSIKNTLPLLFLIANVVDKRFRLMA